MCGIAGVFGPGPCAERDARVYAMVHALSHRGPDGIGAYSDERVTLGHARLSIIDLASGQQPLANEDESVWVVFNGEIYNFVELRAELEGRGHVFRTRSDTEVLVHAYEEYGDDLVRHLNGQFAFALWDTRRERLVLARDRVGICPLFYAQVEDRLFFGSEVKALLAGGVPCSRLDPAALDETFTFWFPLAPRTAFAGIHQLEPGQLLIADRSGVRCRTYWSWSYPEQSGDYERDERKVAREVYELLLDATRLRLRADVPVACYLSGGLDSSIISALVARYGGVPVETFSLGFEERQLDESAEQRSMAAELPGLHHQVSFAAADLLSNLEQAVWHVEAPLLRTGPVPMFTLSRLVREHGFKVVLTGEGADEVFAGYDLFKEAKIRRFWARAPNSSLRPLLLRRLYPYLDLGGARAQKYLEAFFGAGLDAPDDALFSHAPRFATAAKCKLLFSSALREELHGSDALAQLRARLPHTFAGWHWQHRAQYLEATGLLPNYLLSSQGERMLMANSVEGRFPFLDHRLIEAAARVDPRLLLRALTEKHVLKRALGSELPASVVARKKQPYRAPGVRPLLDPDGRLVEPIRELLSHSQLAQAGYFEPAAVGALVQKLERGYLGGEKEAMALVAVISTQLVHRHFISDFAASLNRFGARVRPELPVRRPRVAA